MASTIRFMGVFFGIALLFYVGLRIVVELHSFNEPPPGDYLKFQGAKVHYVCKGAGPKTVIFETGFGSDSFTTWEHISNEISTTAKSCYYDRLGYGWSDPLPDEFSTSRKAALLAKIINSLSDNKPVVLVAHSYGGIIARRAISDHKIDVDALILVDSAHENQHGMLGELLPPIPPSVAKATYLDAFFGLSKIRELFSGETDSNSERLNNYYGSLKYSSVLSNYANSGGFFTPLDQANINIHNLPLLVLEHDPAAYPDTKRWNESNKIWSKLQAELANLSNNSERKMVPMASHNIPGDNPQYLVNEILTKLKAP